MMFSRGSINGGALNDYQLNGGTFVVEASASADMTFAGVATVNRRAGASGASVIGLNATGRISLRLSASGTSGISLTVTGYAARRVVARGAAPIGIIGSLTAARRVNLQGVSAIAIDGTVILSHTFLRRAANRRIMEMRPEVRFFNQQAERRAVDVPREITKLVVGKDRRNL